MVKMERGREGKARMKVRRYMDECGRSKIKRREWIEQKEKEVDTRTERGRGWGGSD